MFNTLCSPAMDYIQKVSIADDNIVLYSILRDEPSDLVKEFSGAGNLGVLDPAKLH